MARTNNLGNVAVYESKHKKSKLPWTHDVNTTMDFGDVQPLMCKGIFPNSTTKLSLEKLVWLSPLVSPVYGKCTMKSWNYFVKMTDLTRNFKEFMAETPVTRGQGAEFVPTRSPFMNLATLSLMVLFGAHATIWARVASNGVADGGDDNANNNDLVDWQLYNAYVGNNANGDAVNVMNRSFALNSQSSRTIDFWSDNRYLGGYNGAKIDMRKILGSVVGGQSNDEVIVPLSNPTWQSFFNWNQPSNLLHTDVGYNGLDVAPVYLDKADEVIVCDLPNSDQDNSQTLRSYAIAFRLNSFGKRLKKIIQGMGYKVDFYSTEQVQIFKFFAYYKAYFDTFGLLLYENYENTACCKLLNEYDNFNYYDFGNVYVYHSSNSTTDAARRSNFWLKFVDDLAFTYVTDPQDYVSAHTRTIGVAPQNGYEFVQSFISTNHNNSSPAYAYTQVPFNVPSENNAGTAFGVNQHSFINSQYHGALDSEVLMKLYMCTNRDTIAGKRVYELCKLQGLGDFIDHCKPNFIGSDSVDIDFKSVMSQSDTFKAGATSSEDTGAVLGERAGSGYGYDDGKKFTYSNSEPGYWVTFAAIVPQSGYCQGVDGDCKTIKKMDFYQPEYDGVGMEATPKSNIVGSVDWHSNKHQDKLKQLFGFIPKYSSLKVVQNVINGDFANRGTRDRYVTFFLDKLIYLGEMAVMNDFDNLASGVSCIAKSMPVLRPEDLAVAGNIWRYTTRYQYLSRLRRIFKNEGHIDGNDGAMISLDAQDNLINLAEHWEYLANQYDNFIAQCTIYMDSFAPVLPISDSFETRPEGNKGEISTNISKA